MTKRAQENVRRGRGNRLVGHVGGVLSPAFQRSVVVKPENKKRKKSDRCHDAAAAGPFRCPNSDLRVNPYDVVYGDLCRTAAGDFSYFSLRRVFGGLYIFSFFSFSLSFHLVSSLVGTLNECISGDCIEKERDIGNIIFR
jgi:hypothetical protein